MRSVMMIRAKFWIEDGFIGALMGFLVGFALTQSGLPVPSDAVPDYETRLVIVTTILGTLVAAPFGPGFPISCLVGVGTGHILGALFNFLITGNPMSKTPEMHLFAFGGLISVAAAYLLAPIYHRLTRRSK